MFRTEGIIWGIERKMMLTFFPKSHFEPDLIKQMEQGGMSRSHIKDSEKMIKSRFLLSFEDQKDNKTTTKRRE